MRFSRFDRGRNKWRWNNTTIQLLSGRTKEPDQLTSFYIRCMVPTFWEFYVPLLYNFILRLALQQPEQIPNKEFEFNMWANFVPPTKILNRTWSEHVRLSARASNRCQSVKNLGSGNKTANRKKWVKDMEWRRRSESMWVRLGSAQTYSA